MTTARMSTFAPMRTLARLVAGSAATAALMLGLAGTANASPSTTSLADGTTSSVTSGHIAAPPAAAVWNLPNCVSVRHTTGAITQTVYITNNCSYALGYYVDREGPNSSCYHISAGTSRSFRWGRADAYHGTYRC